MIVIKLSGGLGNNMFQYAAAKSIAKQKNINFIYFSNKDLRYFKLKIKKTLREVILRKKEKFYKQLSQKDLSEYFLIEENFFKIFFYRIIWILKNKKKKNLFVQKRLINDLRTNLDEIDVDVFKCKPWTKLEGSFSSEKYFLNKETILNWFTLKKKYKKLLCQVERKIEFPTNLRCCVHVRRGDALFMDKGFDHLGMGWGLPLDYYKSIFKKLPINICYIFVSDDPDWVEKKFNFLKNKIVLRNNNEVIDMFIFTKCKYNVVARSTFSWWGAWLNQQPDKVVFAPKFFIGAPRNTCYPLGLDKGKEVSSWKYINLNKIKNEKFVKKN